MDTWLLWSLVLFVVGVLIAVIEVMVPSAGLLAFVAAVCLLGSLVCAYQVSGLAAVILGAVELVCVPVVIVLALRILPRTSFGRELILAPPTESGPADPRGAVSANRKGEFDDLLGHEGVVVTMLRPSGTAEIDGRRVSVVSNGEVIAEQSRIRVVRTEGSRVVVEAVES